MSRNLQEVSKWVFAIYVCVDISNFQYRFVKNFQLKLESMLQNLVKKFPVDLKISKKFPVDLKISKKFRLNFQEVQYSYKTECLMGQYTSGMALKFERFKILTCFN